MPLVRIDLPNTTAPADRARIVDVVYDALRHVAGAPEDDRFFILTEHGPDTLVMDRTYLVARTEQALIIQITLNAGRSTEVKKALFRAVADGLHERTGIRTEDVFINLIEVPKENWSFGGGKAQYAD
ncbi:tautomerase family protein [uncultured Arthrobacter sp.]|uniref:tautomerase family protein n=1 Tax=uncultured Arthrobacter sp. TaxID=114050 RepID=UPI0025CFE185|nr:tautomerase family protein [uncultured Arthrobacter sp.]